MRRVVMGIALICASIGCGGGQDMTGPGNTTEHVVASVAVTPDVVVFHDPGETLQLTVVARDASGSVIPDVTVQWSSADASVVRVGSAGLAEAVAEGTSTVTASVGSVSGSASVSVTYLWSAVAPGSRHVCALRGGKPYCWGAPIVGDPLNPGDEGNIAVPRPVETDVSFVSLDAGLRHTCGLTADGDMYCWGQGDLGQLGTGLDVEAPVPVPVAGGLKFVSMSLGDYHTCALTSDGTAYCWGGGGVMVDGRDLAVGHQPEDYCVGSSYLSYRCTKSPRPVNTSVRFAQISAGLFHTCGIDAAGVAYCWGWNRGMLGNGESSTVDSTVAKGYETPVPVAGGWSFTQVSAGNVHSCGITTSGSALCWGGFVNNQGQLGTGTFDPAAEPVAVLDLTALASIEATKENSIYAGNTCALGEDGAAYCWGADAEGQVGTTVADVQCQKSGVDVPCTSTPLPVDGGLSFVSVQSGLEFTCGVTVDGTLYCWGVNTSGQLGNGTFTSSSVPTKVLVPS